MVRATTPTITLIIKDTSVDLTAATNVYATLSDSQDELRGCPVMCPNHFKITLTGEDIEVEQRKVKCWLSQEQSLQLTPGQPLYAQLNWTYVDSGGRTQRAATSIGKIMITKQLLCEVIS